MIPDKLIQMKATWHKLSVSKADISKLWDFRPVRFVLFGLLISKHINRQINVYAPLRYGMCIIQFRIYIKSTPQATLISLTIYYV